MRATDPAPGSEVAQVFVSAVCGVLVACVAVLVWLWVDDRPELPPTSEVEVVRVLDSDTSTV